MHTKATLSLVVTLLVCGAVAAPGAVTLDSFAAKTYRSPAGGELRYREFSPNIEAGKKYPLILFLHGAGGRGNDNRRQLTDAGFCPGLLKHASIDDRRPCFMIAPQVPRGKRWVEVHWGLPAHDMPKEPSPQLRMALELVEDALKRYPVDESRVYVTGLSMGGFGTWDAIQRRPGLFAAAVPVCGGGETAQAPKLTRMPLWVWHGDRDTVVKTQRSRDMVAAIRKAGGDPLYTEVPNTGHGSWKAAYSSGKMWDWLFAQKKSAGPAVALSLKPAEKIRVACVGDSITFGAGIQDRKRNAYPARLDRLLGEQWDVRNYGVSGRTMLKKGDHPIWRERAYREAKAFKPHIVVIVLGTNDSKPQNWKYRDDFAADTAAMVDDFRALQPKPAVFLCRPVPVFKTRWGINEAVVAGEIIPLIDRVAREKGTGLIDLHAALDGKGSLFPDHVHPDAAGAKIMAETIAAVLKAAVSAGSQ